MDNDLGISEALAALFDMVHAGNKAMDNRETGWSVVAVLDLLNEFDRVLGFLSRPGDEAGDEVKRLAAEREKARQARNWAESDRIRNRLAELGWEIRDTPAGPKLKKKTS